jgi:hypothetical protein
MLRGARTDLTDDMLGEVGSFNVVSRNAVAEQVSILLGAEFQKSVTTHSTQMSFVLSSRSWHRVAISVDDGAGYVSQQVATIDGVVYDRTGSVGTSLVGSPRSL